ncbi:hypothetical protein C494_13156 [Natronorubrum bangense JCM 10635]|uniref:Uncharacterized protein n=1 Tax=Natronorubrum bangense JCM 10635 TaxID=1227500 RepID=L9WCS2_9EURY|nr:hypothetical protein C494_13156 [Natronorubrum bangense JCM 10635]
MAPQAVVGTGILIAMTVFFVVGSRFWFVRKDVSSVSVGDRFGGVSSLPTAGVWAALKG